MANKINIAPHYLWQQFRKPTHSNELVFFVYTLTEHPMDKQSYTAFHSLQEQKSVFGS